MRDVTVFDDPVAYRDFVFGDVFADAELVADPEVAALIDWVVVHRAPLFARPTDVSERGNFSNWFGLVNRRDNYTNASLESLYLLHEFAHLLTATPPTPTTAGGLAAFAAAVARSELVASTVSELWVYHRVPALRARVFTDQRILFDRLVAAGWSDWSLPALIELRRTLVFTNEADHLFFAGTSPADRAAAGLRDWYKSFTDTPGWGARFGELAETHITDAAGPVALLRTPPHLPGDVTAAAAVADTPRSPVVRAARFAAATETNLAVVAAACGSGASPSAAGLEGHVLFAGATVTDPARRTTTPATTTPAGPAELRTDLELTA